jgi:hypothetical protein
MLARRLGLVSETGVSAPGLVVVSVGIALVISLGIVWGARLLGTDVGAALPGALGAAGAAAWVARARLDSGGRG